MPFDVIAIDKAISQIVNPAVEAAAQSVLDLAIATGNSDIAGDLLRVLGSSAAADISGVDTSNSMAVFGAGRINKQDNLRLAGQFLRVVGPTVAYGYGDTPVGRLASNLGQDLETAGVSGALYALENLASAMFANAIGGDPLFVSCGGTAKRCSHIRRWA